MAKHCTPNTQHVNLVKTLETDSQKAASHKRRIIWLSIVAVASLFYVLDLSHVVVFGFLFEHVSELVLTSGVAKFIGE